MNALCKLVATMLLAAATASVEAGHAEDALAAAVERGDFAAALDIAERRLAASPDDPALLFERARILAYGGDDAAALDAVTRLRERFPHDVDYMLLRAQLLAQLGHEPEALDDLRRAAAAAPDYEAVWRLRHALLSAGPGAQDSVELASVRRESAARFPDADWWRPAPPAPAEWTLTAGAAHDKLSNGLPSWRQSFIQVDRRGADGDRYFLRAAHDDRYDNTDTAVAGGADFELRAGWFAGGAAGFAASPAFLPELDASVHFGRTLADGWVAGVRYRRRDYAATGVDMLAGTVERYAGAYRIAYTLGISKLSGASASLGHGLATNWYYSDAGSVGLALNFGEEAEAIGAGQVIETDVRGVTLSGRRRLGDRAELQWWLAAQEQGDFYRRHTVGLAVSFRL